MFFFSLFVILSAAAFLLPVEPFALCKKKLKINLSIKQLINLANEIKQCQFSDNSCLLKTANYVLQNHFKGHSALGLESLDPLKMSSMKVEQSSGPVNILANLKNVEITGFSKAEIYEILFDKNLMTLKMKMPKATLASPYDIDGYIFILPVKGNGKILLNFS